MMLASDQMKAQRALEINYEKVNRLIIIGNGFDLAHGLKTSFKDFIEDYFYEILASVKDNLRYDDPLISITSRVYGLELTLFAESRKLMSCFGLIITNSKSPMAFCCKK